jgi:hypothetical protein
MTDFISISHAFYIKLKFRFENISVGNHGHFCVKCLFPDDGTHQVITRLDTKDSSTAAPFNVFVSHLAPPSSILNPFRSSLSSAAESDNNQQTGMTAIVVTGIITGAAVLTVFIMKRK